MAENEKQKCAPEAESPEEPKQAKDGKERKESKKVKKSEAALLQAEVERLNEELAHARDAGLRLAAEYDNFRKRTQKEKEASYGDSKAATLSLLLPVIDNFDRAAENKTDDIAVYRKGIEMTLNQFSEILKKLDVEAFGEVGEPFDPAIHNAVMHVENEELPENSVAAVFSKGYRLGDRILRCAAVQVAN